MGRGDKWRPMRYLSAMDSPSQWEWPWKLLALVLFGLAVTAVWWFANKLFMEWLPDIPAAILGYCILIASAIGYFLYRRSMARQMRSGGPPDRR